ncbi:PREDICTED: hornerin-like [Cyphomyrmex costatus]|uniref:hornerin-like n=1 Tax=Cyphomyrmex costatus TaxID=456900 RepID=UPI000852349D|nr:PREDICTED: hornerin-like [Cyphomyrmex costatus]
MRVVPALQLTTICAKQRRCDVTLDISARGYLPSPRPFFHRTRGDPCIKAFFLLAMASETTISFNHSSTTKLRDSYDSTPFQQVFLVAFACGVSCNENLPSQLLLQLKDKRGINDNLVTFPSGSSSSYSAPVHSSLSSGYELGGSSGGFSLGHGGLLNSGGSVGHGIGYSLAPSSSLGLGSGYQSPGLSQSHLSHQSVSLGGHSAQSTYSVPSIAHLGSGGSSNTLFAPAKTGPVTFGTHGGSAGAVSTSSSNSHSAPIYTTGGHGLSAYSNGGSNAGFQLVLGSSNQQHGLSLGSSGASSGYSLPTHSASSSSSHPVTGGLIIASGSHGSSSSYSLPTSTSSHSISTLGSSSGTQGASATYSLPISSGSHGISALSSGAASSSYPAGSSSSHSGFSSISSGGSNYQLPIASGSHSNSGSSNAIAYTNYLPSHSSGSSASYSSPSVSYASPSISHVSSPSSGFSGAGASYTLSANYAAAGSSPVVTYTGSHGYTPTLYSSSSSHGTPADSQGAYTSVSPRYFGYISEKAVNADLGGAKYDTISYSVPNGKY